MKPCLCLGTAQIGLNYGITNKEGKVPENDLPLLFRGAKKAGFTLLDTAQAYGEAERLIGQYMDNSNMFRVITKMPRQKQSHFTYENILLWEKSILQSLALLRVQNFEALMIHSISDLHKPGSKYLEEWLIDLRKRGIARNIGVSIYRAEDLEGLNPQLLDIVQLPMSLYDQNLLNNGTVQKLKDSGSIIHARSIYLQGLLLTPPEHWPNWINPKICSHHQQLVMLARARGCRLIDLVLGFAKAQESINAVVLGVCSLRQVQEIEDAWSAQSPWHGNEWQDWSLEDRSFLDPRQWKLK